MMYGLIEFLLRKVGTRYGSGDWTRMLTYSFSGGGGTGGEQGTPVDGTTTRPAGGNQQVPTGETNPGTEPQGPWILDYLLMPVGLLWMWHERYIREKNICTGIEGIDDAN
jgi:hypothetical protein